MPPIFTTKIKVNSGVSPVGAKCPGRDSTFAHTNAQAFDESAFGPVLKGFTKSSRDGFENVCPMQVLGVQYYVGS